MKLDCMRPPLVITSHLPTTSTHHRRWRWLFSSESEWQRPRAVVPPSFSLVLVVFVNHRGHSRPSSRCRPLNAANRRRRQLIPPAAGCCRRASLQQKSDAATFCYDLVRLANHRSCPRFTLDFLSLLPHTIVSLSWFPDFSF
ncbi:hypothetical protein L1887_35432 [Cichorium endivia]|nr:hypothetical protein L1887_35432 [Cichorium endivia]